MKRVLLKLSGEALAGEKKTGFDEATVIEVYHDSNIIISPLRVRYFRKYHEQDGAVSHIPKGEEEN